MSATSLNPAQLEMLKMMSKVTDSETLNELKQTVSDFFVRKAKEEIDRMWEAGDMTDAKVEGFRNLHDRKHNK